jgi:2-succinyl-5-enolpyruvyl-6-hydroxy-3-cyclohexene-1-carboxylate synthase
MGIAAKEISTQAELQSEISAQISGISIVVVNVPPRESNADFLQGIYKHISSM